MFNGRKTFGTRKYCQESYKKTFNDSNLGSLKRLSAKRSSGYLCIFHSLPDSSIMKSYSESDDHIDVRKEENNETHNEKGTPLFREMKTNNAIVVEDESNETGIVLLEN